MEYGIGWKGNSVSGTYRVIDLNTKINKKTYYDTVIFENTQNTGIFTRANIKGGIVKDRQAASVYGIGIIGENTTSGNKTIRAIYYAWKAMVQRCKDERDKLDDRWVYFENFKNDFFDIPFAKNYLKSIELGEKRKWALDKDCSGYGKYSLDSVIYLPYELNKSINKGPQLLQAMGATLPTKQQIINYVELNFEKMIK